MLVDCPDCARSYRITADEIGADGRVVVCPRCEARWFQQSERSPGRVAANDASWLSMTLPTPDRRTVRTAPRSFARSRLVTAIGLILFATAAVACTQARESIVRTVPRMAGLYAAAGWPVNVRGLEFTKLTPAVASPDTTITGEIRNIAPRRIRLPRITFEIQDAKGASLVSWSETPPAATLAAGKVLAFASAPHRLPPESRAVIVHFQDDAVSLVAKKR